MSEEIKYDPLQDEEEMVQQMMDDMYPKDGKASDVQKEVYQTQENNGATPRSALEAAMKKIESNPDEYYEDLF